MTNSEIIEILQYMRHDVLANSDRDIALVKAIEALSVDINTLNLSDGDIIIAKIYTDNFSTDEIENICKTINRRFGDTSVIFIQKDVDFTVDFTVSSKSDVIYELQRIIDRLEENTDADTHKMSNADMIRSMSDDDLADFLDTITDCCNAPFSKCEKCPMKYKDVTPRCNISEWLKQEVQEDAGTDD